MITLVSIAALGLSPTSPPQNTRGHQPKDPVLGEGRLLHLNQLQYIPVSLGGRGEQWFVLDTGSYRSYVTKRGAAHLKASGLRPRKDGEFGPLQVKVAGVSLGKASFALDTIGFPGSSDPTCDGFIGLDLLQRTRLGVDVAAGRFRVWPAKTPLSAALRGWFPSSARPLSTPMWRRANRLYAVMMGIPNMKLPACVDTGCEESYLARELVPALRPSVPTRKGKAAFYTGVEDIQYYRVPSVALEGQWVPLKGSLGATRMPNMSAILGIDVLRQLHPLLDFSGGRLYYKKLEPTLPSPKISPFSGLSVDLPTGVTIYWPLGEVVRVEPGWEYDVPEGYKEVERPDGTLDLVPPGVDVPPFKVKPRLLLAPTVGGKVCPADQPTLVPPKTEYTFPPGWRKVVRKDGSVELHPPAVSG